MDIMDKVERMIAPGIKTEEINTLVHEETLKAGAVPAPLNYRDFPKVSAFPSMKSSVMGFPGSVC